MEESGEGSDNVGERVMLLHELNARITRIDYYN